MKEHAKVLPAGVRLVGKLDVHRANLQLAWSTDGRYLAGPFDNDTVRIWRWPRADVYMTLKGHSASVMGVAWSADSNHFASSTAEGSVRIWSGLFDRPPRQFQPHTAAVYAIRWHPILPDILASGSEDTRVAIIRFDRASNTSTQHKVGHLSTVIDVDWSPDGALLASASLDGTVRLWEYPDLKSLRTINPGSGPLSLDWLPGGTLLAMGCQDATIRIWSTQNGQFTQILEGHTSPVVSVSVSSDGRLLASRGVNGEFRMWRTDRWESVFTFRPQLPILRPLGVAFSPTDPILATLSPDADEILIYAIDAEKLSAPGRESGAVHYSNAKIVVVGDSGVGKSGLSLVLSAQPFSPTDSTHGRRVFLFGNDEDTMPDGTKVIRETLLWDLAGQPGYRLVHQLSLSEAAAALVVFDSRSETDPFAGVYHWDRALKQAERSQTSGAGIRKLLVAGRADRGGVAVSQPRIEKITRGLGYYGYFETSAKQGQNIAELRAALCAAIDWSRLPRVASNRLFQDIKAFIVKQKNRGLLLVTVDDLYVAFLTGRQGVADSRELREQFEACLGLVDSRGLVRQLSFGGLVLLRPEYLDSYASAMVNSAREEPDGLGCISESTAKAGAFRVPSEERIADPEQEKLLTLATIEELLRHEIALREDAEDDPILVFPSQFTNDWPEAPDPEGRWIAFEFEGAVMHIYATLAVRLAQSSSFQKHQIWRNAVLYTARTGGLYGIWLRDIEDGKAEISLFCREPEATTRAAFENFVFAHLQRRAVPGSVRQRLIYQCPHCSIEVTKLQADARRRAGYDWMVCNVCEHRISASSAESVG